MSNKHHGFTIVELLIVIVVIGILAAISVVAYSGIQDRSRTSIVNSDLSNVKKKLMEFNVYNDRYPINITDLISSDLHISDTSNYEKRVSYSNFYYCTDTAGTKFAVGARVAASGSNSYYITSDRSVTSHSGLISQALTCGIIGLSGTGSAQGAYSTSGLSATGVTSNWLKVN